MKLYLLLVCLLLSACAGLPKAIENSPVLQLSYTQINRDTNGYKNAPIRWGGIIINVQNEGRYNLIQVLFYPLNFNGRPDLGKPAEGHFVLKSTKFLDAAIYAKNKEITITGVIIGNIKRTIDEKIIQVPLLSATAMYVWPQYRSYYSSYPYEYSGDSTN